MPRRVFKRQSSSQESLASIHQHEGYSNQERLTDDVPEIVAKKRKKTCDTSKKKKSFHKTKRSKMKKGYYNKVKIAPTEYLFYSVLNTNYAMDQGTAAAVIARSLIKLHEKLDNNNVLGYYLDMWTDSGQNIIILEGFDHKHLKYLHGEVKYVALDTHILHRQWSTVRDILVLTAFGQQEDMEEVFEGLLPLR